MATTQQIPWFANGSYSSQSLNADCERTVNFYPEQMESAGGKSQAVLYPCPGFALRATFGVGPIRGMFAQNGRKFVASGYELYEEVLGVPVLRGALAVDLHPAQFTSNGDGGNQLFITSGDVGYCYDLITNTLTTELASGATMCGILDGYFLVLDAATSTLKISAQFDGTMWDPTQFAQRSLAGDTWVGMIVVNSDIWLMGSQTSEPWYDSGAFPFPFAPRPGNLLPQGVVAPFSLAALNNVPVWVSQNAQGSGMIHRLDGYAPLRISTHALEYAMQGYADISDAVASTYQEQGHTFYVVTFPSANATWAYDAATSLWHERGYGNSIIGATQAIQVGNFCHFDNNTNVAGDRVNGNVYTMSIDTATDVDGAGMWRIRQFRLPSSPALNYMFYNNAQLDMETGVGLSTGQGSDPQVMLSVSNDAGHTFGNERWVSAGALGNYNARARWVGWLVRARNAVVRIAVSDPVPWRLLQFGVSGEEGTS